MLLEPFLATFSLPRISIRINMRMYGAVGAYSSKSIHHLHSVRLASSCDRMLEIPVEVPKTRMHQCVGWACIAACISGGILLVCLPCRARAPDRYP